jgi:hypothetical protein
MYRLMYMVNVQHTSSTNLRAAHTKCSFRSGRPRAWRCSSSFVMDCMGVIPMPPEIASTHCGTGAARRTGGCPG